MWRIPTAISSALAADRPRANKAVRRTRGHAPVNNWSYALKTEQSRATLILKTYYPDRGRSQFALPVMSLTRSDHNHCMSAFEVNS